MADVLALPARARWAASARLGRGVRREPLLTLSVLFLAFLVFASLFPGAIAPDPPNVAQILDARLAPGGGHLFGTDQLGRDVFSRVLYGARVTLVVGILSTLLGAVAGGLLGLAAGYAGGIVDVVAMRLADIMLAFPGMLLAMAIVAAAGPNNTDLILAVGISIVPGYARLMRNQVLSVRERGFIEAAVASGARPRTVAFGHLLPNAYAPLIGFATLGIGISILVASSLSFLGLGPPPPTSEWGAMVSDGSGQIADAWWMSLFPGLAIVLTVLAVGVVGQWLRKHFDIRDSS